LAYAQGLTLRRTCTILKQLFGLDLSPGGLIHLAHRTAENLEEKDAELVRQARSAGLQHVDETGWWVAGAAPEDQPHWLWVFAGANQTLYRVDHRRNRQVVQETLGKEFSGVLVSDCLNIYDGLYARQHKCYAHHLKVISAAQAEHEAIEGAPSGWLGRVRVMLKAAMGLKAAAHQLPAPVFRAARKALEAEADRLLASHRA